MEITGKVIEKLPLKEGTGQNGPWTIAQLVVEFLDGQYKTNICLQNSKRASEFEAIPVGATGKFRCSVSSRKANTGAWFTSCICFGWEIDATSGSEEPAPDGDLPF